MSEIKVNKISPRTACGTVTVGDSGDSVCVSAGVAVTVQGDLKSPALKATDGGVIISQSGTDITVGASGDTINLASGASQSGFGRTGTVDWVTTPKVTGDSPVTAVTGKGYFLNTTAGTITINLPAGAAGSIVSMADYAATWQTNNVTVAANGTEKIGGVDADVTLNTEGQSVTLVYIDSTQGWINTMDSTSNVRGVTPFVHATGGNAIVCCGDYKTHIFTGPGTFCVSSIAPSAPVNVADYLVVAGGGSSRSTASAINGGGGGGGFRLSNSLDIPAPSMSPLANATGLTLSVQGYPIAVGAGGVNPSTIPGGGQSPAGAVSSFDTIPSAGGGGSGQTGVGGDGGSGGGGSQGPTPTSGYAGGAGDVPNVTPDQGTPGGAGYDGLSATNNGGGGGGAGVAGGNAATSTGGAGGTGSFIACAMVGPTAPSYGTPGPASGRYFAGGGGGSTCGPSNGSGGAGGGGASAYPGAGTNGTINTGGGSGGGGPSGGGSGVVIIRYKFQ